MDELKWYLYDIVREVMKKYGISETQYALESDHEGAVCLKEAEDGYLLTKKGEEASKQEDLYHACHLLFLKVISDEKTAEDAMAEFLTATMDLPKRMEKPSFMGLSHPISVCQAGISEMEKKAEETGEQKYKRKLNLDRVYLKGLMGQMEEMQAENNGLMKKIGSGA